jgi:hypothetical protein
MMKVRVLGIAMLMLVCAPAVAQASETVKLKVAFTPYRIGSDTTITSSFAVATSNPDFRAPITKFELRFPSSLSFSTSNLGLAICNPTTLEADGLEGCPPNAQIGRGRALVVVPIGPELVEEETAVTALVGPSHGEEIGVLLYTDGETPVSAQILFQGELLEGNGAFGELLETSVPLIPSVPGAGDASVTNVQLSIDPSGLTYYKRVHGRAVGYHPRGFELPQKCPSGGFQFSLITQFADGSNASAAYTIPCPPSADHRRHRA